MWIKTKDRLPEEDAVVLTVSDGGTEQKLKRQGTLWFLPDASMYVYYTPVMWKYI